MQKVQIKDEFEKPVLENNEYYYLVPPKTGFAKLKYTVSLIEQEIISHITNKHVIIKFEKFEVKLPYENIVLHALDPERNNLYLQLEQCESLIEYFGVNFDEDTLTEMTISTKEADTLYRAFCDGATLNSTNCN